MNTLPGRLNPLLAWLLIGIYIAGGSLWSWYAPSCIDDYTYSKVPREYTHESFDRCDGRPITTLADSFDAIRHDMVADNGRLSNFVHILFVPFGDAPERVANALALALFFLLMCMLAGRNGRITPGSTALTLIGIWVALPWYDGLQALVFQTNYVWGGAILCAGLLIWPRRDTLGPIAFGASSMLMWLLGWWHEGFAIAILVFMATDIILNSGNKRRRGILLIAAAMVGLLCNLGFGTVRRIITHDSLNGNVGHFGELLVSIILDLAPVFLALALIALAILRAKSDRRTLIRTLAPWLAAMCAMVALSFALQMYGRTFWPALMFAIIINVWMLRRLVTVLPAVKASILFVLVVMSVWWFCMLIHYERKVRVAYDGFVAQLEQRQAEGQSSNVVYGSLGGSDAVPWYLLGIPDSFEDNFEASRYLATNFGYYNNVIVMLPDSLKGLDFESLPLYDNEAGLRGVWPTILAPDSTDLGILSLAVDAPGSKMSPVDYLLARLKGDHGTTTYPLNAWRFPVVMPNGREVFAYYVVKRPRTKRYRRILGLSAER